MSAHASVSSRIDPGDQNNGDFPNAVSMDFDLHLADGWLVWRVTAEKYKAGQPTGEEISHDFTLHSSQCRDIANMLMRAAGRAKGAVDDYDKFYLLG
ncbi:MAG: hypothetical protein JWR80_6372 [Bradyrhizobium sp.]|nr:hypothetical protein [Bradyrhizobium sp.]